MHAEPRATAHAAARAALSDPLAAPITDSTDTADSTPSTDIADTTPGLDSPDTRPAALGGPPPPAPRGAHARLGPVAGALLLAALALLAQWLTQWAARPWLGGAPAFIFILPAVVLAAALWGRAAGLGVLLLGMAGSVPLLLQPGAAPPLGGPLLLPLLLLAGVGGLLVALGARLRQLRRRARAAEARLMLAIEGSGMAVFEVDLPARRVHLSPGLARHLGLPPGPLPLQRWLASLPAPLLQAARAQLAVQAPLRSRSYEQELQLPPRPGGGGQAVEWLLLRMQVDWSGPDAAPGTAQAAAPGAASEPVQLRGVCLDITARKRAEAALAGTRRALQQQVDDLDMLHQLSSRLLEVDRLDAQLGSILQALARAHGAVGGLVAVRPVDGSRLEAAAATGLDDDTRARVLAALAAPEAHMRGDVRVDGRVDGRVDERLVERIVVEDTAAPDTPAPWRRLALATGVRAVHAAPLVSRDGVLLGAIVLLLPQPGRPGEGESRLADICARKAAVFIERARAQAALAAEKDRFQAVLESSAVPFAVLAPVRDAQGAVTGFRWRFANGAAARALGCPPGALPGQRVLCALRTPGDGSTAVDLQPFIDVVEQGQARQLELRLQINGRAGWVDCIASPVQGEVAVWFNDITERKHDEAQLRDAGRRKDEFLAMLAHELRNPLAPIRQAALLLREPDLDPDRARWCHAVIERQVAHMATLLDDLLDVSRITRGTLALRRDSAWLQGVVDAAVETARPLIDARGQRLTLDLPAAPVPLHVDPLRLSQVLGNLLANAARYTGRGGRITLHGAVDAAGLQLTVSDDGIGIPADGLERVFDMFSQLKPDGDRVHGGLGIGLALSRALVELHGGRISAHSDGPGRGSRFSLALPPAVLLPTNDALPPPTALDTVTDASLAALDDGPAPPPAPATPATPATPAALATPAAPAATPTPTAPAEAAPGGGLRMLVADDNRDAAGSLAMLLQLHGHAVHQAFDGEHALAQFERVAPQVCLLDIGMPRRDGYSVARAIRRSAGAQPLLIAVTGWGQAHDRQRALDAGFDHHLTKPVDIDQLLDLVKALPGPPDAEARRPG